MSSTDALRAKRISGWRRNPFRSREAYPIVIRLKRAMASNGLEADTLRGIEADIVPIRL
jgi:hypothetical protein